MILLAYALASVATAHSSEPPCEDLYKKLNRTAHIGFDEYTRSGNENAPLRPNSRPLEGNTGYNGFLKDQLESRVPEDGLMIDVGGGRGLAARQLAEKRRAKSIVINTQEPDEEMRAAVAQSQGRFNYHQGWAEEELAKFKGAADLITDVYGAYSYSIEKPRILEAMYGALKPGGMARVLVPPNSVATVALPEKRARWIELWRARQHYGLRGDDLGYISLPDWLVRNHPDVFSIEPWNDGTTLVLVMKKPAGADSSLSLGLSPLDRWDTGTSMSPQLAPEVMFVPPTTIDRSRLLMK